jgi:predicted Zn-dependent protease
VKVMLEDESNAKAIYRLALMKAQLGDGDRATELVRQGLALHPDNTDFDVLAHEVKRIIANRRQRDKQVR